MTAGVPALGPAERRLLLHAARLEVDAARTAELVAGPLDWDAVLFHARLHSVASLLLRQLEPPALRDAVPDRVRRTLLPWVHAADYRNRIFARENAALLDAFGEAGIPVLVPKGLALLEHVYGSLALRPLIDLIFLVDEERLDAVRGVFRARGYHDKPARPVDGLYRWSCPQLLLETFDGLRMQVYVVWDLMTWPRLHALSGAELWRRARPATLGGRKCLLLSPEDQVLYLCLQADNHGYFNRPALGRVAPDELLFAAWSNNRLVRFVDVHESIRALGPLDWDRLVERAAAAGVAESVHASLRLTRDLLGPGAPEPVLDALGPPRARRLRRFALEATVPSLRPPGRHPLRAAAGAGLRRLTPWWQIRAGRLVGLAEYAFPERRVLRLRDGPRPPLREAAACAGHAARALARSLWTPVALWAANRLRPAGSRTLGPDERAPTR